MKTQVYKLVRWRLASLLDFASAFLPDFIAITYVLLAVAPLLAMRERSSGEEQTLRL